jgi:copper homeostasis protein (lipoprotein)
MPGDRLGLRAATLAACVAVSACAQSPALPQPPQERVAAADPAAPARGAEAAWAMAAPRIDEVAASAAYAGARTYSGTLFCAGCAERRLTLTIFPDGTFRMLQTGDEGTGMRVVYDMGRWSTSEAAADTIALHGDTEGARLFRRVVPDGLAIVDNEGREIRGLGNATLSRAPQVDPLSGPLRLAGSYLYEGGQPVFVECLTGRRLPVTDAVPASGAPLAARWLAAARSALDDAHRAVSDSPADPVLAIVRGYLVPRAAQAGSPDKEALVVVGFERAMRAGRCEDVVRRAP